MSVSPLQRSAPVRTCVGCRQRAAKADLLRVVVEDRGAGREVVPDPKGRRPGRGAHLHPELGCLQQALRRRAFTRALRVEPASSSAPVEEYVQQLTGHTSGHPPEQHHPSVTDKKLEQQLMSTR